MVLLAALIAAVIGWAVYTRRLQPFQVPPLLLGLAGTFLMLRGNFLFGLGAVVVAAAWGRGISWRLFGTRAKQTPEYHLASARWMLGVTALDDAATIKARHRDLIAKNHPDTGGSAERAKELNEARDMLLNEIAKKGL